MVPVMDHPFLKSGGNGNRLDNRSRLVALGHTEILPAFIQCLHVGIIAHLFNFFLRIIPIWIAEIILMVGCHRQNAAGVGIHDDHTNVLRAFPVRILRSVFLVKRINLILDCLLNVHVQRYLNRFPVVRLNR